MKKKWYIYSLLLWETNNFAFTHSDVQWVLNTSEVSCDLSSRSQVQLFGQRFQPRPSWVSPLSLSSTPEGRSGPPPALHHHWRRASAALFLSLCVCVFLSIYQSWRPEHIVGTKECLLTIQIRHVLCEFSDCFCVFLVQENRRKGHRLERGFLSPDERVDGVWDELSSRGVSLHLGGLLLRWAAPVLRWVLHYTPRSFSMA